MNEYQVIQRIRELCNVRSWTIYRLAKESNITYSTLSTLINKENMPSISTLSKICDGFGISLSQFFNTDDDNVYLLEKEKKHLKKWKHLTEENQKNIDEYIDYLLTKQ